VAKKSKGQNPFIEFEENGTGYVPFVYAQSAWTSDQPDGSSSSR
jgi:hypothetical protein